MASQLQQKSEYKAKSQLHVVVSTGLSCADINQSYLYIVSLIEFIQLELVDWLGFPQTQVANSVGAIPWNRVVIAGSNHLQENISISRCHA